MAKKKAEVPAAETAVVESPENVETVVETTQETTEEAVEQPKDENSEEVTEVKEEETVAKATKPKKAAVAEPEIPANVQRILKAFNNMPELYVSNTGRVFSPGAKPSLRGNAILYKNPFYNSKS